ncbi:transcription cofactor vestigial-like protein 2 [Lampetra planeri]
MSCLDVMYHAYGPPARAYLSAASAAYSSYPHAAQKLQLFPGKMSDLFEGINAGSSAPHEGQPPPPEGSRHAARGGGDRADPEEGGTDEETATTTTGAAATTTTATTTAAAASSASGDASHHHHQQQQQRHEKERVPAAQYLTSRCLLLTYFRGDIASEVDEHFSRALSQQPPAATGTRASTPGAEQAERSERRAWKDRLLSPMTQRNFPPSFWSSSTYHHGTATAPGMTLGTHPADLAFSLEPYPGMHHHPHHHHHHHHHHHPHHPHHHPHHPHHHPHHPHHPHHHLVQQQQEVAAAWHYPLSSQAGAYSRGVSDLYSAGTHPFDPLYGPLLVPPPPPPLRPARLPPALGPGCDLGKASESPVGGPWGQAGFAAHSPVEVAQSLNAEAARRYGLCSSSLMS